jgi:hypothetical protein
LAKPVIVSGDAVDAGLRVVHVAPLFVEYSWLLMAAPPSDAGGENLIVAVPSLTDAWLMVGALRVMLRGVTVPSASFVT